MVWTSSRRCCWKWRNEDFVGCYDPVWKRIKERKLDIVVVNKNERTCAIIDITIPGDIRVSKKEKEKNWEIPGTKDRNQKNVEH